MFHEANVDFTKYCSWANINVLRKGGINVQWTITVNEENQYAEVVTRGIADRDGSLGMAKAISMTLSKKRIKRY